MERESISYGQRKNNKSWKVKPKETKPVLSDPDVKKHLEELHQKFVFITVNKNQIILHLYVESTSFPSYYRNFSKSK